MDQKILIVIFCFSRFPVQGIFYIFIPLERVVDDVLSDTMQFILIADDMFVVITLPSRYRILLLLIKD